MAFVLPNAVPLDVGLIGLGALGAEIVQVLRAQTSALRVTALVRDARRRRVQDVATVSSVAELLAREPRAVIEVAGHDAVATHVPAVLAAGIPVILASTGALWNTELRRRLTGAQTDRGRLVIPAGAIGALDYLRAVGLIEGAKITYTSRKPPGAWLAELRELGLEPHELEREVVLFSGSAAQAAGRFPRNLNVAMTIALAAGNGPTLEVRVVADPNVSVNTHDIQVHSALGVAMLSFSNEPSATNPKSSRLTAYSLCAELRQLLGAASCLHRG